MSKGIFTDKTHRPTRREITAAVGSKLALWEELIQFIRSNFSRREELKFYGKNYGWAVRFSKGGKALASLYPAGGSFTVQIVLRSIDVKKALAMNIGPRVRKIINAAHPYPEGRWLFIPVDGQKDLRDVRALIALKSGSKVAPKENHR